MDAKNFVLSYYQNSTDNFHIHKVERTVEAQKPHTHEYFQIYYIIKGRLVHYVENESSTLSHGDMFIIPPKTVHHIVPEADTVFYSFSFMPDFIGERSKANRLATSFLENLQKEQSNRILPKVRVKNENLFFVESILEHVLKEFEKKNIGYDETACAYCVILLTLLARNYFEERKTHPSDYFENNRQFVLHCIEYIENNFTEDLSLEETAKLSAMSKSSFCTLFSELTGHSFHSYLNLCRIKKSMEYMKSGYKISSIYGLCGYNDFTTFYRNFKKIMGISPKEYQESLANP